MSGLSQDVDVEGNEVLMYSIKNGAYVEFTPNTGSLSFHNSSGGDISIESKRQIMSELVEMAEEVKMEKLFSAESGRVYSEQIYMFMNSRKRDLLQGVKGLCLHRNNIPLDAPRDPNREVASFIAAVYGVPDTEDLLCQVIYTP